MDQLNKQQIVLLTLLVSIVTSIATGITIISLVGQNPVQTVTQTVNRVVEKTIERVVEANEDKEETKEEIIPEKEVITIVVNEEDMTMDAIESNSKSIVRIFNSKTGDFISIGVIINSIGTIYIPNMLYDRKESYIGEFEAGSFALNFITNNEEERYVIMEPNVEDEELEFSPISVDIEKEPRLGQSIISLSGVDKNIVSTGIITSINTGEETDGNKFIKSISTSVKTDSIAKGSILLNLSGEVIGIKTGIESSDTTFYPGNIIYKYLEELS